MPPHDTYLLPPFEIPPIYGPISQSFLATHPLHLALQRTDEGDTQSLLQWQATVLEAGISVPLLGNLLKEYHVQVELTRALP